MNKILAGGNKVQQELRERQHSSQEATIEADRCIVNRNNERIMVKKYV